MKITNDFVFFFSKHDICSNFYPHKFKHQDHTFHNSEQAFMWRKACYFKDWKIAKEILKATQPHHAKSLGRKVRLFDNTIWERERYDIMKQVVADKIAQFPELQQLLDDHSNKTFVEASPYDAIWGIKLAASDINATDPDKWQGQNLLGEIFNELKG